MKKNIYDDLLENENLQVMIGDLIYTLECFGYDEGNIESFLHDFLYELKKKSIDSALEYYKEHKEYIEHYWD